MTSEALQEAARIARLHEYALLDSERTPHFDRIVELVAHCLDVPRSAISLLAEDRQWFLAKCGIDADETPRSISFCQHTIVHPDEIFVVEDAHADPRFRDNPLVTGPLAVRFYAGVPLRVPTGEKLGALCAIDARPRQLSAQQRRMLRHLASIAVDAFELRRALGLKSALLAQKEDLARALELRSAQALEAAARAERLARGRSQFLANMSHEIRTPMNGVMGMAEELLRSGLSAQQRQMAETLLGCADGLLGVLNDILDLSKLEEGRMSLETLRVDMEELLRELARLHGVRAREKDLALTYALAPGEGAVMGDPTRMRQILNNLVGNAIKFTIRGGVHVGVSRCRSLAELVEGDGAPVRCAGWHWLVPLAQADQVVAEGAAPVACQPSGDYLGITVADSGIGMDPEQCARLGEAYTQADASISRRFGGSGLGMSITAKLVARMGGGMALASSPGKGTLVALLLPLALAPRQAGTASCAPRPALERPMHVLLAEDNEVNRQVAAMHLKAMQCSHVHVADGQAAIREAMRTPFDLILMDVQMPVVSGIEAIERIRAQAGPNQDTPIIALTASVMVEEQRRVRLAGADQILGKPYRRDALVEAAARAAGSEVCFDAAYWEENFHDVDPEDCRALLASALESWAGLRDALHAVPAQCISGIEVASIAHRAGGSCGLIGYRMAAASFLQWERSARRIADGLPDTRQGASSKGTDAAEARRVGESSVGTHGGKAQRAAEPSEGSRAGESAGGSPAEDAAEELLLIRAGVAALLRSLALDLRRRLRRDGEALAEHGGVVPVGLAVERSDLSSLPIERGALRAARNVNTYLNGGSHHAG